MPDPLPSMTSSTLALSTSLPLRNPGRSNLSVESSTNSGSLSVSTSEETPHRNLMWTGGPLSRLHPARNFNFKDDMEVFSPLVEVQPITPSLDNLWNNDIVGAKKDNHVSIDKKPSLILPSSKRFPLSEDGGIDLHPVFDWKSTSTSRQVFTCLLSFIIEEILHYTIIIHIYVKPGARSLLILSTIK